jgi:hypothetical protein
MAAAGVGEGFFHLAEDLRLAQHQRIEAAGDAHQMADGVIILMPVKAFSQVFFVEAVVVAQPADQRFLQVILLFDAEIEFRAVAGRQHHPTLHHRLSQQALQRLIERFRRKRDAFSQGDRSCFVIDAKS